MDEKKILYLECNSGISGDMTVAALLDLGADKKVLLDALEQLHVPGYRIEIKQVKKNSLSACDFDVILDEDIAGAGHGHEHGLHKHEHHEHAPHEHEHHGHAPHEHKHEPHMHEHEHEHHEPHVHAHGGHTHVHRNLFDINEIIDNSPLPDRVKETAKRIFLIVAAAEATVHGEDLDKVHFHEVGAVDSIVDIVAAAVCLDNLNIDEVIVSPLSEGTGMIRCQHGLIPVPVPATAQIAAAHGLVLHPTGVQGELVTPTGAAIAAAIRTRDRLPDTYQIEKIGLGAGKRNHDAPNVLRAMLIREV